MSCKLREFIRNTRAAKTAADERAVVSKECAEIRTAFKASACSGGLRNKLAVPSDLSETCNVSSCLLGASASSEQSPGSQLAAVSWLFFDARKSADGGPVETSIRACICP